MFLFSVLQAAIARIVREPVRLSSQEFIFSAPTFSGDPLLMALAPSGDDGVVTEITDSAAMVTTSGVSRFGALEGPGLSDPDLEESEPYKGLTVGMTASRSREFSAQDVADFLTLTQEPNPLFTECQVVPPGLLAGVTSWVLGVDLPGRGTNWLKQRYVYHRPVLVESPVTSTATITRIRPDKGLVNLATRTTVGDDVAVTGEALVLAVDVAERPPGPA